MTRVLIVGNGPAGHRTAELLRRRHDRVSVTVFGAEAEPAYNRVLLSSVIAGRMPAKATYLTGHDGAVTVHTGMEVREVDPRRRIVSTADGAVHPYDALVLATGARCFVPPLPGLVDGDGRPADGVVALRTIADCTRLEKYLPGARYVVVLGGGVLGLEAARALTERGLDVDLVHMGPHLMERQLDPPAGRTLAEVLVRLGIRVHAGRAARAYQDGRLALDDGTPLPADVVVVSAGVVPETELARRAGLLVGRGVVVDDHMRTSDPNVYAIGDCAEHAGKVSGLIAPAWEQAETVVATLTGSRRPYAGTPSVMRLKTRGVDLAVIGDGNRETGGGEVVTLTDPARGRYARLSLRDDRVAGAILLGFPAAVAAITQLFDAAAPVPHDRLALLAGHLQAGAEDPGRLPDEAVVCRCNNVTKQALVSAVRAGAHTTAALAERTRATTGCGGCAGAVESLCRLLREQTVTGDAASSSLVTKSSAQ